MTSSVPPPPVLDPIETYHPNEQMSDPASYPAEPERLTRIVRESLRDLGFVCAAFFVNLAAFVVCTVLFSLGVGTLPIGVGLWVLLAGLVTAGAFAQVQRRLLSFAGHDIAAAGRAPGGTGLRALRRLRHGQSWRDLLHVLVVFVVSTFSFSVGVSLVASALGGLTYGFWSRYLPADNQGLAQLLGLPGGDIAETALNTVVGAIALLLTPLVLRGLVTLHAAIARGLLVDENAELRERVGSLTESRAAAGDAELQTLRRLERDLHDGPQQRLVRLGMDISAAQRRMASDPDQAAELLDEAFRQSQDALAEIRNLSRGIAPPILSERGLEAAVRALAARNSVPTSVDAGPVTLGDAALTTAYFVVAEALANMEKHSGATWCSVQVRAVGVGAVIIVTDDGAGGASVAKGHGLAGLQDRLTGVGGTLTVTSPAGGPTVVTATLPQRL